MYNSYKKIVSIFKISINFAPVGIFHKNSSFQTYNGILAPWYNLRCLCISLLAVFNLFLNVLWFVIYFNLSGNLLFQITVPRNFRLFLPWWSVLNLCMLKLSSCQCDFSSRRIFISNCFIRKSVLQDKNLSKSSTGYGNAKQFGDFSSDPTGDENRTAASYREVGHGGYISTPSKLLYARYHRHLLYKNLWDSILRNKFLSKKAKQLQSNFEYSNLPSSQAVFSTELELKLLMKNACRGCDQGPRHRRGHSGHGPKCPQIWPKKLWSFQIWINKAIPKYSASVARRIKRLLRSSMTP